MALFRAKFKLYSHILQYEEKLIKTMTLFVILLVGQCDEETLYILSH